MSIENDVRETVCDAIVEDLFTRSSFFEKAGTYYMITGNLDGSGKSYTAEQLIEKVFELVDVNNRDAEDE